MAVAAPLFIGLRIWQIQRVDLHRGWERFSSRVIIWAQVSLPKQ